MLQMTNTFVSRTEILKFPVEQRHQLVELLTKIGHIVEEDTTETGESAPPLNEADKVKTVAEPSDTVAKPTDDSMIDASDESAVASTIYGGAPNSFDIGVVEVEPPAACEGDERDSNGSEDSGSSADQSGLAAFSFDPSENLKLTNSSRLKLREKGLYRRIDEKKVDLLGQDFKYYISRELKNEDQRTRYMSQVAQALYYLLDKVQKGPDDISSEFISLNQDPFFDFIRELETTGTSPDNVVSYLKSFRKFVKFSKNFRQIKDAAVVTNLENFLKRISEMCSQLQIPIDRAHCEAGVVPRDERPPPFDQMIQFLSLPIVQKKLKGIMKLPVVKKEADYRFLLRYCVCIFVCMYGQRPSVAINLKMSEYLVGIGDISTTPSGLKYCAFPLSEHKSKTSNLHRLCVLAKDARVLQFYAEKARGLVTKMLPEKLTGKKEPFFISTTGTKVKASPMVKQFQRRDCQLPAAFKAGDIRKALATAVDNSELSPNDRVAICQLMDHDLKTQRKFYVTDSDRNMGRSCDIVQNIIEKGAKRRRVRVISESSDEENDLGPKRPRENCGSQELENLDVSVFDKVTDQHEFRLNEWQSEKVETADEAIALLKSGTGRYHMGFLRAFYELIPINIHNVKSVDIRLFRNILPQSLKDEEMKKAATRLEDIWINERDNRRLEAIRLQVDFSLGKPKQILESQLKRYKWKLKEARKKRFLKGLLKLGSVSADLADTRQSSPINERQIPVSPVDIGDLSEIGANGTLMNENLHVEREFEVPQEADQVMQPEENGRVAQAEVATCSNPADLFPMLSITAHFEIVPHLKYQTWLNLVIDVVKTMSPPYNRALFAFEGFMRNTVVCDYKGAWKTPQQLLELEAGLGTRASFMLRNYLMEVRDSRHPTVTWYICAHNEDGRSGQPRLGRLINHSAIHPNVKPVMRHIKDGKLEHKAVLFVALRDIMPGEELCYNYGKAMQNRLGSFFYVCHCRKCGGVCHCKDCRGEKTHEHTQLDRLNESVSVPPDVFGDSLNVECSLQSVIAKYCTQDKPNRPFVHPNMSQPGEDKGQCAVRAIAQTLISTKHEPARRRTELEAEIRAFLTSVSIGSDWFSYGEVLMYFYSREPFVPFVIINAAGRGSPLVTAAGVSDYHPEEVAVVVVLPQHWSYLTRPLVKRARPLDNAIDYSEKFLTLLNEEEIPDVRKVAEETNNANLQQHRGLSALERARQAVEEGKIDLDDEHHRLVIADGALDESDQL